MQAAIAATHARAASAEATDWPFILLLYDQLAAIEAGPVVALNRAVELASIEPLACDPGLRGYHLLPAVRCHLLLELGRAEEAAAAFRAALECRCSVPERRFLEGLAACWEPARRETAHSRENGEDRR